MQKSPVGMPGFRVERAFAQWHVESLPYGEEGHARIATM